MDAAEKAEKLAQAVGEALNCLAIFLCGPALQRFRPDPNQLLGPWETSFAPTLRKLGPALRRGDHAKLESAVEKISSAVKAGVSLDAPEELAPLRRAIREAMVALSIPLPDLTPAESEMCELHGAACPVLADAAE